MAIAAEKKYGVPACVIGGMACEESRNVIGKKMSDHNLYAWSAEAENQQF
jgi:hypothetical protein